MADFADNESKQEVLAIRFRDSEGKNCMHSCVILMSNTITLVKKKSFCDAERFYGLELFQLLWICTHV